MAKSTLTRIGRHSVPSRGPFVVSERCVRGIEASDLRIGWCGEDFLANFSKLVEPTQSGIFLVEYELNEPFCDRTLLQALGGIERCRITLGQLWSFLGTADRTKWYIAFVSDQTGTDRGVHTGWCEIAATKTIGLHVESGMLHRPYDWAEGARILIR